MKRLIAVLAFALVLGGLVTMGSAQTTTGLGNVASFQPTSSSPFLNNNATYGSHMAVNDGVFRFFHASENSTDTWWKVDLGQAYDIEHLVLKCRHSADGPGKLNGATLQAFGEDGVTPVAGNWLIDGFANASGGDPAVYTISLDNNGVGYSNARYFQIGGPGLGVNYMVVGDFQAFAQVPAYDTFIQGVTATATYTLNHVGVSPTFLVDHSLMDDQRGLLGDPNAMHRVVSGQGLWVTVDNPVEAPVVTFDLGGTYELDKIAVWNSNQNIYRNVKECLVETSVDGVVWTALADMNGEEAGNYTLAPNEFSPQPALSAATDTIVVGGVAASHVRMTMLSNYGPHPTTGINNYGLSEVRFYQVPEPSSLFLLVIGAAWLLYRRR